MGCAGGGAASEGSASAPRLAHQRVDLRFKDGGLEQEFQAYKRQLEPTSSDTIRLSFACFFQSLALRRQWGAVAALDRTAMVGGIILPIGLQMYKRCCPEAYARRRLSLRSILKLACLLITARIATYGSRVDSFEDNWIYFVLYTSLYGRWPFLAMSVLFLQVRSRASLTSLQHQLGALGQCHIF